MWMKNIFLAILGLSAGITAAGGLFSFIIGLGVVSDFADRTHTGEHVMLYEDAIAVGGSIGAIISVYHPRTIRKLAGSAGRTFRWNLCRMLGDGSY